MSDAIDSVVISDERCKIVLWPPKFDTHGFEHRVDLVAGAFRGSINAVAYANAYGHFRTGLVKLYETLSGEVAYPAYENLDLKMTGDGRGHIEVSVRATDDFYRPIQLSLRIFLDQTQLPTIIDAIERVFLSPSD
jgi:hypothetical protein